MAIKIRFNRSSLVKAGITLLSAAIVVLTPLILLNYNIEVNLMDPGLYKQILKDQKIYDNLSGLVADQLVQQIQAPADQSSTPGFLLITKNSEQILKNLDQAELQVLIDMLLPSEWAKIILENLIDQYFASMDNRIYSPTLLIAMNDIKGRLQSDIGLSFFVELIRAQPPCSEEQMSAWQSKPLEEAPACFPSETILKESEAKTTELLYQITARMPDYAGLDYFFGPMGFNRDGSATLPRLQNSAERFWRARVLLRISPVLLLALVFLLGLFHTPDKSFTKLVAAPVALAGAASLITTLLVWPLTQLIVDQRFLANLPAYLSPALIQAGRELARIAIANIVPLMTAQSVLIILLGGLLYLADRLRQRRFRFRKPPSKKYTLQ